MLPICGVNQAVSAQVLTLGVFAPRCPYLTVAIYDYAIALPIPFLNRR